MASNRKYLKRLSELEYRTGVNVGAKPAVFIGLYDADHLVTGVRGGVERQADVHRLPAESYDDLVGRAITEIEGAVVFTLLYGSPPDAFPPEEALAAARLEEARTRAYARGEDTAE